MNSFINDKRCAFEQKNIVYFLSSDSEVQTLKRERKSNLASDRVISSRI